MVQNHFEIHVDRLTDAPLGDGEAAHTEERPMLLSLAPQKPNRSLGLAEPFLPDQGT